MKLNIFTLIVTYLCSIFFSMPAQEQSILHLNVQQKPDNPAASLQPVEVLNALKIKRFLYKNLQHRAGEMPPDPTPIKPRDKHFFLVIEMAFAKGESIVRTEPVYVRADEGKPSMKDLVYVGSLGHRLPLTQVAMLDTSGDRHLPVASTNGTGVYLVEPLGGIKATIFSPGLTDIGFPDKLGIAEIGRMMLVYEIPAACSGFRLKVGDSESIAINVKT